MKKQLENTYIMNTKKVLKKYNDEVVTVKIGQVQADLEGQIAGQVADITSQIADINSELDTKETVENVNTKVETAKGQAIEISKEYTDGEVAAAKNEFDSKIQGVKDELDQTNGGIAGKIETLEQEVETKLGELKSYVDTKDGEMLEEAKAYTDGELAKTKSVLEGKVTDLDERLTGEIAGINGSVEALEGRVGIAETDITNLKNAISNKNNNTVVVETESEIAAANPNPKIGDLAYVISSKRAYIFKGVEAPTVKSVPAGWVVFDEITSELDLYKYAKIEFVEGKIAEAKATLEAECDLKATKIELAEEVSTLNEKIAGLVIDGGDTTQEIEGLKGRIEVNEGAIAGHETRILALESVQSYELSDEDVKDIIDFVLA